MGAERQQQMMNLKETSVEDVDLDQLFESPASRLNKGNCFIISSASPFPHYFPTCSVTIYHALLDQDFFPCMNVLIDISTILVNLKKK